MNGIKKLFETKQKDVLNIYFTAGHPGLHDTGTIIKELADAGVDLIEVGMPYSDPLADGLTIQQSSSIALKNGMKLDLLFEQLMEVRKETDIPLILMGYFNQVMRYGPEKFLDACQAAKIDGLILPDMPLYEYEENFKEMFESRNIAISFLITPMTEEERILKIDKLTKGFIYMVSSNSTTGGTASADDERLAYFKRIEGMNLKNPRLIGFGISDHASFSAACAHANGAIIGSAFIRALQSGSDLRQSIRDFVRHIKSPVTAH